jgi:hypothetical protein
MKSHICVIPSFCKLAEIRTGRLHVVVLNEALPLPYKPCQEVKSHPFRIKLTSRSMDAKFPFN